MQQERQREKNLTPIPYTATEGRAIQQSMFRHLSIRFKQKQESKLYTLFLQSLNFLY